MIMQVLPAMLGNYEKTEKLIKTERALQLE
jgi:hypothetical protein